LIPYSLHSIGEEEIQAVSEVMRSGYLTGGPKLAEFEAKFAEYVGASHAIAVNSGAAALYMAIKAIFPGRGAIIALPALTYVATANAVVLAGHIPRFVDIDPDTFCIDPYKIGHQNPDAVISVHYAGHPCDLDAIYEENWHIPIIEDAAHACGAEYKSKKIGSINIACFSFHPSKNMTTGEGGMITTNSNAMAEILKRMRLNGIRKIGIYQDMVDWGFKFNMNEIQAAIGIEQLKKINQMNSRRRLIAIRYEMAFENCPGIKMQKFFPLNIVHSRHLFSILLQERDKVAEYLQSQEISCAIHYKPVHLMSWYRKMFHYEEGDFPVAEEVAKHILSIPIYPDMTDEQVEYVIEKTKEAVWASTS
jgi:dTDP-4-amino-4,6-dideoxygalactose transaminase